MLNTREKLLKKAYEKGFEFEKTYHGCAQCTIAALQEFIDIDDSVFKAATALAGGLCRQGSGPCGGFSGGLLVLGSVLGRDKNNFGKGELIREAAGIGCLLKEKFVREYGSYRCHDIQEKIFGKKFNLWDEKDYELFEKMGAHETKCPDVVGKASKWVLEILLDNNLVSLKE